MAPIRVANLDLLRALAIALVVVFNATVEGGMPEGLVGRMASVGWVGVDLFFVLSGWLIGGLFWRELGRYGGVQVGRFWARRWLRTIPPYLVALHVVYLAKRLFVDPALEYDWGYLAFAQNYYADLPYWGVSWSLCVEEHFYLALPLALSLGGRMRGGMHLLLAVAVGASLAARVLTVPDGASPSGLQYTATHMRLEGLALGVWASYVYYRCPSWWPPLQRVARAAAVPGLLFVASVPFLPLDFLNRFAYTGVDLAFAAVLVAVATRPALPAAGSRLVQVVAVSSYSVYMTHTMALEVFRRAAETHALSPLIELPLELAVVLAFGSAFYLAVEWPTLWLRERLVPQRARVSAPAPLDMPAP